jgi:hypothetical protein
MAREYSDLNQWKADCGAAGLKPVQMHGTNHFECHEDGKLVARFFEGHGEISDDVGQGPLKPEPVPEPTELITEGDASHE